MPEAVLEKEICDSCGVDVREGTAFCYNCGARVAGEEPQAEAAGDDADDTAVEADDTAVEGDLSDNGLSPAEPEKLAAAANKRKRARVSHRKTAEYVWEPTPVDRAKLSLVIAVVIFVIAFVVVVLMLDW